jgi:RHS repeat-associated protein
VDSITNGSGAIEVRLSFASFGSRRNEATWSGNPTSGDWTGITGTSRRGFTFHESLDNLSLVHMNGRVFDPVVGRFLSADPFVPAPALTQSFNRYSYTRNNPLAFIDPSGFGEGRNRGFPNWWGPQPYGGNPELENKDVPGWGPDGTRTSDAAPPSGQQGDPKAGDGRLSQVPGSFETNGRPTASEVFAAGGLGVPINVMVEGKAYTITPELVVNGTTMKAGLIAINWVVRPNCSLSVPNEAHPDYCESAIPSHAIEDAALLATGIYGAVRGALATTEAAGAAESAVVARARSAIERGAVSGSQRLQLGNMGVDEAGNLTDNVVRNASANIGGRTYTGHALDQMQNRGLTPSVIENTISSGATRAGNTAAEIRYFDSVNNLSVVLDRASGRVVTVRYGD